MIWDTKKSLSFIQNFLLMNFIIEYMRIMFFQMSKFDTIHTSLIDIWQTPILRNLIPNKVNSKHTLYINDVLGGGVAEHKTFMSYTE